MFATYQAWIATREEGQGLVEYALILVLVALVVIGALTIMGVALNDTYTYVITEFNDAVATATS